MEVAYGARTDVGLVRESNEDAFHAAPPLFVVADGMGGHQGGDVASALVVEAFAAAEVADGLSPLEAAEVLSGALAAAQQRINDFIQTRRLEGQAGFYAGTTAVAAVLVDDGGEPAWLVANVGDSRAYALSEEGVYQVTVDHSRVQELVDAGLLDADAAVHHPERNVVTRALGGSGNVVDPDLFLVRTADASRLLLCSDGVSGLLDEATIGGALVDTPDAQEAADRLVDLAIAAGGHDNATALVLAVR